MWDKFTNWMRSLFSKGGGQVYEDIATANLLKDDSKGLKKLIDEHKSLIKSIEKSQEMFDGEFEILKKAPKRADDPNNKIIANYSKIIVGMKANYMLGKPVIYNVPEVEDIPPEGEEYEKEFIKVLENNDDSAIDFLAIQKGLIAGGSVVLFYFDEFLDIKYQAYTLNECIPIVDQRGNLIQVIHVYTDNEDIECVEIWDSRQVTYLVKDGDSFVLDKRKDINPAVHYLPIVPATFFVNGEYAKPRKGKIAIGPSEISLDVSTILEKLSDLISNNQNRLEIFCDPFLVFTNTEVNREKVLEMRQSRAINIKGDGAREGKVDYLIADFSSQPLEWQAATLVDILFETTNTPKIFKQEAIGALSGVAIKQLYTPLDNSVNEKEIYFNKYIRRKVQVITLMLNAQKILAEGKDPVQYFLNTTNTDGIYDYHWMDWENKRNLPQNETELIDNIMKTKGTVSEITLLKQIPFVENPKMEKELIKQEALDEPIILLDKVNNKSKGDEE